MPESPHQQATRGEGRGGGRLKIPKQVLHAQEHVVCHHSRCHYAHQEASNTRQSQMTSRTLMWGTAGEGEGGEMLFPGAPKEVVDAVMSFRT